MKYTTVILLTALSLFSKQAYAQEIPFELQREVIRMNNDLKHYKQENKSLNVLIREMDLKSLQQDSVINNQSIIINRVKDVNAMLNAEVLAVNNDLRKETRKKRLFKAAAVGLLVALPVSFVGGFIFAQRGVVIVQ